MSQDHPRIAEVTPKPELVHHGWFYRRTLLPILALLRVGASPRRLAWSIAIGALIGINPLLGSTTVLCLAVASALRLNVAASQVACHAAYPLELLLFLPFLQIGTRLFHTEPLPLSAKTITDMARHHPIDLVRALWIWEWHAFAVWAILALVATPLLALALTPLLQRLLDRVRRRQYPIAAAGCR